MVAAGAVSGVDAGTIAGAGLLGGGAYLFSVMVGIVVAFAGAAAVALVMLLLGCSC